MFLHSFTKNSQIVSIWCLTANGSIYLRLYEPLNVEKRPQILLSNYITQVANSVHLPGWPGFVTGVLSNSQRGILMCHILVSPISRSADLENLRPCRLWTPLFSLIPLFLLGGFRFSDHSRMPLIAEGGK